MRITRFGVIGLGWFGEKHFQVLSRLPNVKVEALCSRTRERAVELARKYGVDNIYTDWSKIAEDPNIDAVIVVTHVTDHRDPVVLAAEHGKHVLVEKPIASTLEDADKMISVTRKAGVHFMVGHLLRFEPRYALSREAIAAGSIGRILSIYARRNIPGAFARSHLKYGTPILLDAIHDTDIMLWYLGDDVGSVYSTMLDAGSGAPNPEITWTVYNFRRGAKGVCESLWFLLGNTPYAIDAKMEIIDDRGAIYIDCSESGLMVNDSVGVKKLDTIHWPVMHGEIVGALKNEISYFVRCVVEDIKPEIVTPEDARKALQAVLAAEESARTARIVAL